MAQVPLWERNERGKKKRTMVRWDTREDNALLLEGAKRSESGGIWLASFSNLVGSDCIQWVWVRMSQSWKSPWGCMSISSSKRASEWSLDNPYPHSLENHRSPGFLCVLSYSGIRKSSHSHPLWRANWILKFRSFGLSTIQEDSQEGTRLEQFCTALMFTPTIASERWGNRFRGRTTCQRLESY